MDKSYLIQKYLLPHYNRLLAISIVRFEDKDLAEDIVQSAYLVALEKLDSFIESSYESNYDLETQSRKWLNVILKYLFLSYERDKGLSLGKRIALTNSEQFLDSINFADNLYSHIPELPSLSYEEAQEKVKKLREPYKTVLSMQLEGKTLIEIAEHLGENYNRHRVATISLRGRNLLQYGYILSPEQREKNKEKRDE